jgi:hypothetical protein
MPQKCEHRMLNGLGMPQKLPACFGQAISSRRLGEYLETKLPFKCRHAAPQSRCARAQAAGARGEAAGASNRQEGFEVRPICLIHF